ncbi:calcium ion binding protein [Aureococcus anophagefferens]|nr:calcium ion binding protein [Aureococcus anophagefferens]
MPTPSPTGLPTSQPSWPLTPDPTGVPTKAPNSSGVAPLAGLYGPWGDGQFLVERLVTFAAFPDEGPWEAAAFDHPAGVALYARSPGARDNETVVVADAGNHVVRSMTAVCSQPCENGGRCVAPETCDCMPGWQGADCTAPVCTDGVAALINFGATYGGYDLPTRAPTAPVPSALPEPAPTPAPTTAAPAVSGYAAPARADGLASLSAAPTEGTPAPVAATVLCSDVGRSLCVAPETCACAPGWAGADCGDPLCAQRCAHGGRCAAPDTCACRPGWFDANCTTPVCAQTCGNGGNCTAPDVCTCPAEWTGNDCREPLRRPAPPLEVPSGGAFRAATGWRNRPDRCDIFEVRDDAYTRFQYTPVYTREDNSTTAYHRYTPLTPYGWNATGWPWRAYAAGAADGGAGRSRPWNRRSDRQVAFFEYHNVTQGVYACANGGNCTAPDVCRCAEGWSGFDCRTPICDQGYYVEDQASFVSGTEDPDEVAYFERFLDPNVFDDFDGVLRAAATKPGARYLMKDRPQGGYRCSLRARTRWERPELVFDHVNFFYSRYMDAKVERDGEKYTNWSHMAWPPTHAKTAKLEITHTLANDRQVTYIYTNEGHRRDGVWEVTGEEPCANQIFHPTSMCAYANVLSREREEWTEGTCIVEFRRVCGSAPVVVEEDDLGVPEFYVEDLASKARAFLEDRAYDLDISSKTLRDVDVQDTDFAYRPRIVYDDARAYGQDSAWSVVGGECVDTVLRGCFNNGTCVAPGTCRCARGWEGDDCSVPVCAQACHHHGNCTMPDECTCEAGWEGHDCSTPVCAQECYHNGLCVAPDTCKCRLWESNWPSGHTVPRPLFRAPDGGPQMTGWTGFDCSTPVCTQAEVFTLNVGPAAAIRTKMQDAISVSYGATNYEPLGYRELGGRGYDGREDIITEDGQRLLKCDMKPRCPSYDEMVVSNVGESFPQACGYDVLETGCCARVYPDATADEARCIENDPNDKACVDVGTYYCQYCEEEHKHYAPNNFTCAGSDTVTSAEAAVEVNIYDYAQVPPMFRSGRQTSSQIRICGQTKKHMNYEEVFSLRPDYDDYKPNDPRPNSTSHAFLCGVTAWVQGDYIDDGGLCDDFGDCAAAAGVGIRYGPGRALDRVDRGRHVRVNTPNITRVEGGYGQDDVWSYGAVVRGEGIYECANRGTCISPDVCTCMDGWAGFDCTTPLCRHLQYPSGYISACENGGVCKYKGHVLLHPGAEHAHGIHPPWPVPYAYGGEGPGGYMASRGNCTSPNECTCWCKNSYNEDICLHKRAEGVDSRACRGPYQDLLGYETLKMFDLVNYRNLLEPTQTFGTRACTRGFEGTVNQTFDRYMTCHLKIFIPNSFEAWTLTWLIVASIVTVVVVVTYCYVRRKMKKRYLQAKIERRRSRRSEESARSSQQKDAFKTT